MIKMAYEKVCSLDVIPPGSVKSFQIAEKEVMVINKNGQLFCLQARCTHAGAPLAEGTIINDVLTCPWHGSQFNITNGEVIRGPAKKELQSYKFVVENNFLYVELEQEQNTSTAHLK
jgi:nitrite reductase/ring-hydroxylating ferredoxin subunit